MGSVAAGVLAATVCSYLTSGRGGLSQEYSMSPIYRKKHKWRHKTRERAPVTWFGPVDSAVFEARSTSGLPKFESLNLYLDKASSSSVSVTYTCKGMKIRNIPLLFFKLSF